MHDRVALKSNTKYRGKVHAAPYNGNGEIMYTIQWDKDGMFLYNNSALIPEKEADELQAKLDAEAKEKLPKEEPVKV